MAGFTNWLLRPRVQATPNLYHYHRGDTFLPGAQNWVFEMPYTLPLVTVQGQATVAGPPPRVYQPPQVYQNRGTTTAGLGGLQAGQMALQGLLAPSDNDNTTGG